MKTMLTALLLGAGFLLAQAPKEPSFEVASVRPSQPTTDRVDIGLHLDGAQVRIVSLPLRDYIARAYRLKLYQVTGPDWLSSEKFDVNAKLPEGSTSDQIPEMLQALLAERFQLKLHRDTKELPNSWWRACYRYSGGEEVGLAGSRRQGQGLCSHRRKATAEAAGVRARCRRERSS